MTAQHEYFWQLPDGRIWSSAAAVWVDINDVPFDPEFPETRMLVRLRDLDHLRANINFYGCEMGELADMNDLQKQFTEAIQGHLDAFAQTRNYDNILSATTYATSAIPQFKTEGQYAVEARDATWLKGYEILDEVLAGQRPMPTLEEVFAELPPLAWPV